MMRATLAAALIAVALPLTASAQSADDTTQPPTPPNQGPMIIERVHSGFLFAPEVKITDFNRKASGLVGGSAGWVADETVFFGGGGYWMATDRSRTRELAYGGFVMQWFVTDGDRFGLSAKALLGGGRATVPQTVTQIVGLQDRDLLRLTTAQRDDLIRAHTVATTIGVRDDFLVAEPEITARLGLARHVRLTVGGGYRFAGSDWRRNRAFDSRERISGAVGTLGVQIGG
ncbi:MAG TPA: hypothetical protein VKD69_09315 [Vicinamibacterales bacterium]|nr:hypothetical protein [Vicinamibacterales bacterium]